MFYFQRFVFDRVDVFFLAVFEHIHAAATAIASRMRTLPGRTDCEHRCRRVDITC